MPDHVPILPLAYASPAATAAGEPHRGLLTTATVCGALPLSVGCFTLIAFLVTRHVRFLELGLVTILAGIVLVLLGVTCLIIYFWQSSRLPLAARKPHYRAVARRLILLVSNFPAAAFCIYVAAITDIQ